MTFKERALRILGQWPSARDVEVFERWCSKPPKTTKEIPWERLKTLSMPELRVELGPHLRRADEIVSLPRFPSDRWSLLVDAKCEFSHLNLKGVSGGQELELVGLRIRRLETHGLEKLELTGCSIGALHPESAAMRLTFSDTLIDELDLARNGFFLTRLDWSGGYLGYLKASAGEIRGDITIRDLRLPKVKGPRGAQWLRDARKLLNDKNNGLAAAVFHAAELVVSRPNEPWAARWASRVYELGSDFGNSIGRPVAWFFGTLVTIFALALAVGTEANLDAASGWHRALKEPCELSAQVLRAGIYAMQSIFNPLNLIVPKPLVSYFAFVGGSLRSFSSVPP